MNNSKKNEIVKKDQIINDEDFELFQNVLSKELVLELYSIFKLFEKKGLINYNIYIESMTQIFKKYSKNKTHNFKDIFILIFNRFQKIKCIMKNDKKVFYLTNMLPQNKIETYIIVCFLTIFIKCRIIDKIKLLFELTDVDDDGFLNKKEIKLMIATINFMFCEENSLINTNSSILAQSLMNIKVKEKINKLMNEPGNLNIELEKEKYISFDIFYKSLIKIKNYKYEIIPFFINMKQCLYNKRSEKILEVKNKHKKEFVRASSALSSDKPSNPFKRFKRNFSANNLGRIIRNVKINNEKNIKLIKKKKLLLGIKEKIKSFKELLKESTIFSDDENIEEEVSAAGIGMNNFDDFGQLSSISKRISFHNTAKDRPLYIFEADFDKIKKIEVQPALLKFSRKEEVIKKKFNKKQYLRYNSTLNFKSKENFFNNRQNNIGTIDINKKIISAKNNNLNKALVNSRKRASIIPIQFRNDIINNFNLYNDHSFNLYNKVLNNSKSLMNNSLTKNKLNNIINNIKINTNINKNILKEDKKDIKRPFSSINNNTNTFKKQIISKTKSQIQCKNKKSNLNIDHTNVKTNFLFNNFNTAKYKKVNLNKIYCKNKNKKNLEQNKKSNKYLSAYDIFQDVNWHEEKLKHERTEYFGKELIFLYKKMLREKQEIRKIIGKYDKYDISLNFFDFRKKGFPKDYGRSIFSFNKYY